MIQQAFAAGTRDSTGRPGRNYWQLWTDYKINASLDPATSIVTGRETVTIRNNSDSAMRSLVLRLDQNFFTANVPRLEAPSELTDGMQITRLVANGQAMEVTDTVGHADPRDYAPRAAALRASEKHVGPHHASDSDCAARHRNSRSRLAFPRPARGQWSRIEDGPLGRHSVSGWAVVSSRCGL